MYLVHHLTSTIYPLSLTFSGLCYNLTLLYFTILYFARRYVAFIQTSTALSISNRDMIKIDPLSILMGNQLNLLVYTLQPKFQTIAQKTSSFFHFNQTKHVHTFCYIRALFCSSNFQTIFIYRIDLTWKVLSFFCILCLH